VDVVPTIRSLLADLLRRAAGDRNGQREKRVEERLREQTQILDQIHDAVVATDLAGHVTRWNHGAERLYGYTAAEMRGRHISVLYPDRPREEVRERLVTPLLAAGRHDIDARVRRKSGEIVYVHLSLSLLRNAQGRPVELIGYGLDVTERRRAEAEREALVAREQAARAEAERRARDNERLAEVIRRLTTSLDRDEIMAVMCESARDLLQADGASFVIREGDQVHYACENALGPLWKGRRFPIDHCLSGWSILHRRMASVPDVYADPRIPIEAYRPTFVRSLAMAPVGAGEPLGALGVYWAATHAADARERRLLEALADAAGIALLNARLFEQATGARREAEVASRTKDEFLAMLSHELRSPLSAVRMWASLLRTRHVDADTGARALEAIERNAIMLSRLIDDLLDVSRIISGKLVLQTQPVDMEALTESALDAVRASADAKGVALERRVEPLGGHVVGDPARVQQIFGNLLSNAIKFSSRGGRVVVRLARDDGIDAAFLPHVFERFRQGDSTSTRKHGGLGLGLAIVRQLAELHGGGVEATSDGPGRGATFTVRLPLRAEAPGAVAPPRRLDPDALRGVRVLVLDDDVEARESVAAVLEHVGASVWTVASADAALAHAADQPPDVLLSDIAMPGADGYTLLARLRARDSRVPVVALTAYASAEDRTRALTAGFRAHVAKPVDPARLVATIMRVTAARAR
jgi:two-component system CheB/CheR fusion protein